MFLVILLRKCYPIFNLKPKKAFHTWFSFLFGHYKGDTIINWKYFQSDFPNSQKGLKSTVFFNGTFLIGIKKNFVNHTQIYI